MPQGIRQGRPRKYVARRQRQFPYDTIKDALADQFRRCVDENGEPVFEGDWRVFALELLRKGYYQLNYRQDRYNQIQEHEDELQELQELVAQSEDPKLREYREKMRDKELGREPSAGFDEEIVFQPRLKPGEAPKRRASDKATAETPTTPEGEKK